MGEKKVWVASTGPFLYEDDVALDEESEPGLLQSGITTTGQIYVGEAPTTDEGVLRFADIDTLILPQPLGITDSPQFGGLKLGNNTAPAATPADMVQLWAADRDGTAGKSSLHIRTEDTTSHILGDKVGFGRLNPEEFVHVDQTATSGAAAMKAESFTTSTTSFGSVFRLLRRSTGNMADGFGCAFGFAIEDDAGTENLISQIGAQRFGADDSGKISLRASNAGTLASRFEVDFNSNVYIGLSALGTNAVKTVGISSGTAPTTSPADAIQFWSADRGSTAGKASLHIRTEDATSHVLGDRVGLGTVTPGEFCEITGAIKIGDAIGTADGTIRWTGSDFEGRKGGAWVSLAPTANEVTGTGVANRLAYWSGTNAITSDADFALDVTNTGLLLNGATLGTSGVGVIALKSGTAPSTSPTDVTQMWSADRNATAGKAGLHIRSEDGTSHVISDRVGFGTLAPNNALHVMGNLEVERTDGSNMVIVFNSIAGTQRQLTFRTAGVSRWIFNVTAAAESGSDVGSDFTFLARDDSGSSLFTVLGIERATSNISLFNSTFVSGTKVLAFVGQGTAPSSAGNTVHLWNADHEGTAGKSSLHILTEDGTSHVLGKHLETCIGANGQSLNIKWATTLLTIAAAATTDTSNIIPVNSVVMAVSALVTVAIPTATTFNMGVPGLLNDTRYGTAISTAVNTPANGTDDGARFYAAATAIRITPNLTPANNAGRIRITVYYYITTPPTS